MGVSNSQSTLGLLRSALLMGAVFTIGSALVATRAYAQTAPAAPASGSTAEEEAAKKKADEKVVVTGSRIRRNEFTSPSPIQVITNEQSILSGQLDAADVLQQGTLAAGSFQQNNQLTGFVATGGAGTVTLSLRGLGAQRTLVMWNGRRLSPAGTRGQVGAVDLNVLPQSVINRYEILKDGASSVYGSDAVAGVVNAISVRNLDGGAVGISGIVPVEPAGNTFRVNGIWGQRYDDGNFLVAGEYFKQEETTIGDRELTRCSKDLAQNRTTDPNSLFSSSFGSSLDLIDPATGKSKCFNFLHNLVQFPFTSTGLWMRDPTAVQGGGIGGRDLRGLRRVQIALDTIDAFVPGTPEQKLEAHLQSRRILPADFPAFGNASYISPTERFSIYAQGEVQISNDITAYAEFLWNRRTSEQHSFRQMFPTVDIRHPASLADLPPSPIASIAYVPVFAIPSNDDQEVDFYRSVLGFKGDLFSLSDYFMRDWSFDIYLQGTMSKGEYRTDFVYADRLDAVTSNVGCDPTLITVSASMPFGSCAPVAAGINWLSPAILNSAGTFDGFTQTQRNFLFGNEEGETLYEQLLVSGSISGTLFDVPAGEVGAVLGFEARYDAIDDLPGPNSIAGNLNGQTAADRTQGSDKVVEAFGELAIPLLKDLALIKSLDFNASTRFTNYDSYGSESTYKLGFDWRLTDEYRLRGTTGTSFRAPALYELFLGNQTGFNDQSAVDPCANWDDSTNAAIIANCGPGGDNLPVDYNPNVHSSVLVLTNGGAGRLQAETSDAKTIGAVWTPDWVPVSIAVDYFEFEVNNQVARFGAANIVRECYRTQPYNSSDFCGLFTRNLTPGPDFGKIEVVNNSYVNLNEQQSTGLDLTVEFRQELDEWGSIDLDFRGTWMFDQAINFFLGTTDDFNGETYNNDFVGQFDARWDQGPWTIFYGVNMFSRASDDEDTDSITGFRGLPECGTSAATTSALRRRVCVSAYNKQYAEWTATHDISVRWRQDGWTASAGVANIFDDLAPTASSGPSRIGSALVATNYDGIGRRVFFNLGYEF